MAETRAVRLAGQHAIAVRRFATTHGPIAGVKGSSGSDARELFRRMVFNILMDNTDDHEKNHSLLMTDPFGQSRVRLAPAYDLLPTNSGQGAQEFICGSDGHASTLDNAMSQCAAFGLLPAEAAAEVATVIGVVDGWQGHFARVGVSDRDLQSLAERIDDPVLGGQRAAFDPTQYQKTARQPKRTSLFRRG